MVKKLWRYIKPFSFNTVGLRYGQMDTERENFICHNIAKIKKTIQMVNMWQAARKGLKPIELATKKKEKKFKNTNIR